MKPTAFETAIGTVEITHVSMERASGYGQYRICIDINFEGSKYARRLPSTDSQLWDDLSDVEGDKSQWLMERCKYIIEDAIEDFVSSF